MLHLADCGHCPLQVVRNPITGSGPAKARCVIVGEAPGAQEEREKLPFVGPSGQLLNAVLQEWKLPRHELYITNALLCRTIEPSGTPLKTVPSAAVKACHDRLVVEIRAREPELVVCLGATAVEALYPKGTKLSDAVGALQWSTELNAWLIAAYHPAAVLHGAQGYFDDLYYTLRRVQQLLAGTIPYPPKEVNVQYQHITTESEASLVLDTLSHPDQLPQRLALDLETDGFSPLRDAVLQVAIADEQMSYVFEAETLQGCNAEKFKRLLRDERFTWVLHNMAFDLQFLAKWWTKPHKRIDTMALALGLTEKGERVGLKRLAREYLNAPYYEQELKQYLPHSTTPFSAVPRDVMAKYAAADVYYTLRLVDVLTAQCEEEGTLHCASGLLTSAQECFADMESRGVLIDHAWAQQLEREWLPLIDEASKALVAFAREWNFDARKVVKDAKTSDLNPRSFKQLQHLIFDIMEYAPVNGNRTTGAEFLEAYPNEKVTALLKELRERDHLYRTYVKGIMDDVDVDGRVHPDFLLFGTVTGRLSIRNPPLQTIPKWGVNPQMAKLVRKLFKATPGYVLVEADYKQLELRVAWHYSQDKALGEALMSGDLHRVVAAAIFHKRPEDVTGEDRFNSKFVTFGLAYGRSAWSLARGELQCSEQEAARYVENFWKRFPDYYRWWQNVQEVALRDGMLRTPLGRVRRWNLITPELAESIRKQAVNFPIQSLASDICLDACIRLNRLLRALDWGYPLFTVHDAIVFEVREEIVSEALELIRREMVAVPFETDAKFDVDIGVGASWGETKEVEDEVQA